MPFNFFGWLRRRTTESILAGMGDAAEIVSDSPNEEDHSKSLRDLRDRLGAIPRLELQTEEKGKK